MTVVGFVLAHALYLIAGLALMFALGYVRLRPLELLLAIGAGYLAGIAVVTTVLTALLVVKVPVTGATFWIVSLLVAAIGTAIGLRRRDEAVPLPLPWRHGARLDSIAFCALLGAVLLWIAWQMVESRQSYVGFDAAHIWTFKATALTHFDELRVELASNPIIASPNFAGEDYPILQPLFLSTIFRQMGGPQPEGVAVELWLLVAAWVLAVAFLLYRSGRNPFWIVGLIAVVPSATNVIALSNADSTVAVFGAAGAAAAGLWVLSGERRDLVLAAILLGAAANVKAEGLAFAGLVLVSAGAARAAPLRWRRLLPWGVGLGVFVLFVLPWRVWLAMESPPQNQPAPAFTDAIKPSFLIDRASQLDDGMKALLGQLIDVGRFSWVIPAFLVLAVACLWDAERRRLAGFYLAASTLTLAAVVWVYWTTLSTNVPGYINTTADRILLTSVWIAAVGAAHLVSTFVFTSERADEAEAVSPRD